MKTKLLFVMESLRIGGAEKSLVTLLSQLDYSQYEVDLFLFSPKGEFMNLLPKEVNLLEVPKDFENFILQPNRSLINLIRNKRIKLLIYKITQLIMLSIYHFIFKKEYIGWNFIRKSIGIIDKQYDVAIGFLEKKSIYFVVDKVQAEKKIGWIHTDYRKIEFNYKLDEKYLSKLDDIITVSNPCRVSLIEIFGHIKHKVSVIENFISPKLINELANEIRDIKEINRISEGSLIVVTVARLTKAKNLGIIIDAVKILKKKYKIKWFIVGDGELRDELSNLIKMNGLNEEIILVGAQLNPYQFMKRADIYVQTSLWEGFGITVAEAKALNKPIIVSSIPEFKSQIQHEKTGLIYHSLEELINYIDILIHNTNFKLQLINNLSNQKNEEIIQIKQINNLLNRRI
ncbi:glycosyltransferase [Turicibacter sanguinis]|nr:glycosyltransferase [Turicibacter sanguinis]